MNSISRKRNLNENENIVLLFNGYVLEKLLNEDARANECVQSDQLGSYFLNIKPNTAP
ncbi:unnamed protein product, partial [Rotaria sp. Silwood2]